MKTTEKVINTFESEITMPTTIVIGDPSYFGSYDKGTYNKRFRGKNSWLGSLTIEESEITFSETHDGELDGHMFISTKVVIYFAPDEKHLDLYKRLKMYSRQKTKSTEIGVDTARYIIETSNADSEFYTAADGGFGEVLEYYTGSKLEGIRIELDVPREAFSYKETIEEFSRLFEIVK